LMQSTSLAPELSATRSRVSCWITVSPPEGLVTRNRKAVRRSRS
jgi:hypothetical protein